MHKKIIRGVTYYYTTVRENGKIKTIYLGRTKREARRKEAELKGIQPTRFPSVPKTLPKTLPRTWIYAILIIAIFVIGFIGNNLAGYLVSVEEPAEISGVFEVVVNLEEGSFLPNSTIIQVIVGNYTSNLTLDEFLTKSGSEIVWEVDDFQVKDSGGTVAGFIDGATGDMYFKGDLHYNSDF